MPQITMRTIMHIDADAYFASVEQGFNPLISNHPVIVGGAENQRGVVHTASYEARTHGVCTGMPLIQAKAICPDAVFFKGNFEHYKAVSLILQEEYLNYTPIVEFTSLDDAYLDLTGTLHLHPHPQKIAAEIQNRILKKVGVGLSFGIASNKTIANIASGLHKPGGITYVAQGKEKEFLAPLAVDQLPGIGRMAKEKLTDLSIFTIKQLADLPKRLVEQLFGSKTGTRIWEFANGIDSHEVKRKVIPKQISRETSFEEDTSDMSIIKGTLQYLTERVAQKLREQNLQCQTLNVKIRYSDFSTNNRSHSLPHPSDEGTTLYNMIDKIFNEILLRRIRIRHVGVAASNISPRNWQASLFSKRTRKEILNYTIDHIRGKYGFMSILPAETVELKQKYRMEPNGFILHNPALTR
jgi:DNA polymerase-4